MVALDIIIMIKKISVVAPASNSLQVVVGGRRGNGR